MIAGLKPYASYKDSGVPWLGAVPTHWEVRRQRQVIEMLVSNIDKHSLDGEHPIRLCNYVDVYKHDRITARIPFMRATASPEEIERFRLREGDVIITKDSETWNDIAVPALVEYSAPDLVCGYHLALLRPRESALHGAFLLRALQSAGVACQYHISANGVTRYGLSHNAIKSVLLPLPPLPEQRAIVRFLDHADRRIRRHIRAKQRLISLLEEQKQAIIHRAVTRGLDPDVRLKPSGVPWLGDVPEHWEVLRLKDIVARVDQGISPQAENRTADAESWGVLKAGCVNGGTFREVEHKRLPAHLAFDQALVISNGDVLVSRASGSPRLVGSVGKVCGLALRLILSDKIFRLVFKDGIDTDFMVLAMNGRYYRHQVEQAISGAEGLANNLPVSALKAFFFALPPALEQRHIVGQMDSTTGALGEGMRVARHQIALLREYRTRLIADVVTGKLDVREAAARLPDEGAGTDDPDRIQTSGGEYENETEGEEIAEQLEE